MKADKKVIWMGAVCAMVFGLVIGTIGFLSGGANGKSVIFNRSGMHLISGSSHTIKLDKAFTALDLDLHRYDVNIVKSDHYGVEISCMDDSFNPIYSVDNGTLIVHDDGDKDINFFLNFGIFNKSNSITIYIPESSKFQEIKIKDASGDLNLNDFIAQKAEVDLSFGNMNINHATANELYVTMGSGDGKIQNMNANKIVYHSSFGESTFENIKGKAAASAEITAKSGDVKIRNFDTNILSVDNSFGSVNIDTLNVTKLSSVMKSGDYVINNSKIGNATITNKFGKIEASNITSTGLSVECQSGDMKLNGALLGDTKLQAKFGDVEFTSLLPENQYNYSLNAKMGDVRVNGNDGLNAKINKGAKNNLTIIDKSGDINVNFER